MKEETSIHGHIFLNGPSRYHCDQEGDMATIYLGEWYNVALTANTENFLSLASTCQEAAGRIEAKLLDQTAQKLVLWYPL